MSYRKGATRGVEANDGEAAVMLSAVGAKCSTSAQDDMVKNFTGDDSPDSVVPSVTGISSGSISVGGNTFGGLGNGLYLDPNQALVAEGTKDEPKKKKAKKKAKKVSKTRSRRW